jgi:cytoskeletal protein RodZ
MNGQAMVRPLVAVISVLALGLFAFAQQKPSNPQLPDPGTPEQTQQSTATQSGAHSSDMPQQAPRPDSQLSAQENGQDQTSTSNQQTFLGTIEKAKSDFVLRDRSSQARYKLDRQDLAAQFDGKSVKVTGKLDRGSRTIHVATIEPES